MSAAECVPNIGQRGRQLRMRFGVVALALCLIGGIAMIVLDVPRVWRLALFLPLASAGAGIFQARAHT